MNYPNGPYGQGFPGQPGNPQQPGYSQPPGFSAQGNYSQPGYPQQGGYPGGGYQPQPYGMPPTEPSGVTGIIAAVLAALGGLAGLGSGLLALIGLAAIGSDSSISSDLSGGVYAMLVVGIGIGFVFGLVLLTGAVMLFQRKMIGRWLVVGGCALAIVSSLISFGVSAAMTAGYGSYTGGGVFTFLGLIFPITTLVLAMLPSTTAWILAKPNPAAPQYHSPNPGWA